MATASRPQVHQSGAGWRFAAVVENRGKVVRDHVLLAGQDEDHAEGTYYIEWYENGKRHRKAVAEQRSSTGWLMTCSRLFRG